MIVCNHCGNSIHETQTFCGHCGAPNPLMQTASAHATVSAPRTDGGQPQVFVPVRPPDYQTSPLPPHAPTTPYVMPSPSTSTRRRGPSGLVLALVCVVAVAAVAVAAYFAVSSGRGSSAVDVSIDAAASPDALAASMRSAIKEGRLVTLGSNDAYSFYYRLKSADPQHRALAQASSAVLPELRRMGEEVLNKRLVPQSEEIADEDWEKALRIFKWAHELAPSDTALEARWKYAEGELALTQGRVEDAQRSLYTATQVEAGWALPYNRLGRLYGEKKNDHRSAIRWYQRAIDLNPTWEFPHNNMGTAYFNLKEDDSAIRCYQRALEINPRWARPHYWLGEIYERQGLKSDALREYQTVSQLDATFKPSVIEAKIRRLQGY
ncbi:MAG TPA: tetratricopeptide repeat protein [Pyrinomonadaceae bacterium]